MPLYQFAINRDGTDNPVEVDLANAQEAWAEAVQCVGETLRDLRDGLRPGEELTLLVSEKDGPALFSIRCTADIYPVSGTSPG